ncbi:2-amino-4-hydroxy-6-hydroxymethyldihydropteridine diphosphokinase [Pseudoxanthomonas indica]|uniref:2-amino-4-hydroxy-6-hydroxymethyldihydropteridine pyrophosphokinase n=1 Tax=Pseudoxanthomonas indica TaxID=428993 RepID=A0A1T5J1H6_9GAMM|nr:2-amino-4-hydroxy-6-hydroxymethyldihydropteridine diphosphokinase [Pseudoxanthomonas indica]GGD55596.1 2-amino-4-hydroxy-6-hydroxymethyldihydropteridine diphosphokinase [Pseudoxanthomonas indica]SKC45088.1 2-amino-4-hydroxy-6-hydroxymethyldihydropteridinediphosphokinase [Pseudoxanthomonas indica]
MSQAVIAYVGLGANLGDPAATVRAAAQRLATLDDSDLLGLSRLYRTPAWGVEAQPDFINAVAGLRTSLAPLDLLARLLDIEREYGRDRTREQRWGPRTLDLDLLLYGDCVLDVAGLQLPHPRLHERAFALVPLLDLDAEVLIPGQGRARDAVSVLEQSNIQPL